MPELDATLMFSAAEIALFERIARRRNCTFDEAVTFYLRAALAVEPDVDEAENILFFPGFEIGEADGHSS
ncbi:hypothetical protein [Candidatus Accumulibacter vicinus]|uniref:hypothetical protein n=1 Tax=Candidatus Accumulibacter vicinus TaxID=2954382 RepID=UPI00235B6234|nr:hypothetical protein [Candidatus Accumulibacter vicinus]